MNDLNEYWKNLVNLIKSSSFIEGTSERETFISYVSDLLVQADDILDDIQYVQFEGIGAPPYKRNIQIDGYYYDEFDQVLNIYVVPPLSTGEEIELLGSDDIRKYYNKAKAFITEAKYLLNNTEESQPGYGLAYDMVFGRLKDIERYVITLITDHRKSNKWNNTDIEKYNDQEISFTIWDIERLYAVEESQTGKEELDIDIKNETKGKGIPCLLANKTEDYTSYLCNIPGLVLANLYNKYGSHLLEGNVRSFLQNKVKVNKQIRDTILNEPDNFFSYNNGITATATDIEVEDGVDGGLYISHIKALQIVNGGQTTASLAACYLHDVKKNSHECIERISVPMKLTVVPFEKAQQLIPNIARYANSQNAVSETDLWSNHAYHIRLEELSRKTIAPPVNGQQYSTYWFYERAKGQYKQSTYKKTDSEKTKFALTYPKEHVITKTDLAKYHFIFNLNPDIASLGGQKAFPKFADWFKSEWEVRPGFFDDRYFKEIVAMAIIFKYVDSAVKKLKYEYKANINAYAISYLIYLVKENHPGYCINLIDIWNKQDISDSLKMQFAPLIDLALKVLTDPGRTVINVTEWAKRSDCWDLMKAQKCVLNSDVVAELVGINDYVVEKEIPSKLKDVNNSYAIKQVLKYDVSKWRELYNWGISGDRFRRSEKDYLETAIKLLSKGRSPSKKQCIRILQVLERARDLGYLG